MRLGARHLEALETSFDGKGFGQTDHDGERPLTLEFLQLDDLHIRHFTDEQSR